MDLPNSPESAIDSFYHDSSVFASPQSSPAHSTTSSQGLGSGEITSASSIKTQLPQYSTHFAAATSAATNNNNTITSATQLMTSQSQQQLHNVTAFAQQQSVVNGNVVVATQNSATDFTTLAPELENLTDLLQLPLNWNFDMNSLDLANLADTNINLDMQQQQTPVASSTILQPVVQQSQQLAQQQTASHFEFPDYVTPEVTEMLGATDWLDSTGIGALITSQ